ncbi:MAG TPA: ATP-binding protein [Xanthobacteraceae bacterium]|jgi:two-component system phosphate regulon sensor histidine kinase PhoR|nr:ATP-binding protein [Xanthobacteraceae bacterium]
MTAFDEHGKAGKDPGQWKSRLVAARPVLITLALVLAALFATGALSLFQALGAYAVVLAVVLVGRGSTVATREVLLSPERNRTRTSDPLVDAVVAGLPDPVIVLDRNSRVVAFNAKASAIAPALNRGEPASLALRVPEVVEAIRTASASGKPRHVEFSERVPVERWFDVHIIPVDIAGDVRTAQASLMLITFHDLTPLRRVEEMRADFVANASHELRTPLAALSGFIDTLQGPARDDVAARERFMGIMKEQASRMARLIDDLLSLSRIELNAHVRPQAPVDLVAVVRQVADALQVMAADRHVTIAIQASVDRLIVPGDRDELTRVFENLIENALKYGAAGKRVDITLDRRESADGRDEAVIVVRDYGQGIAVEHLPRLTERFYRIDVGQSRAEGGTGLGLALVKHIINRHRGRLTLESTLGSGAAFTVRLHI